MISPLDNMPRVGFSSAGPAARVEQLEKVLGQLPQTEVEEKSIKHEDLVKPVEQINAMLRRYGVQFDLSEKGARPITRIVDAETGEVIRQTPNEAVLRMSQRLEEVAGLLIKEEA